MEEKEKKAKAPKKCKCKIKFFELASLCYFVLFATTLLACTIIGLVLMFKDKGLDVYKVILFGLMFISMLPCLLVLFSYISKNKKEEAKEECCCCEEEECECGCCCEEENKEEK